MSFPYFVLFALLLESLRGLRISSSRQEQDPGLRYASSGLRDWGVSQQTDGERNCRVGGGAKRRYPPLGMMGIAESILSKAEGLNPSYA